MWKLSSRVSKLIYRQDLSMDRNLYQNLADGTYTVEATMRAWAPAVAEGIVVQNGGQAVAPDLTLYPRKKGSQG